MTIFYSASKRGFFTTDIHGDNIPKDAVEVTEEQHQELLNAQGVDSDIEPDMNGNPVAVKRKAVPDTSPAAVAYGLETRRMELLCAAVAAIIAANPGAVPKAVADELAGINEKIATNKQKLK